ncbi:hypothetical protein TSOC_005432, partial [Tetrabaena socialis]
MLHGKQYFGYKVMPVLKLNGRLADTAQANASTRRTVCAWPITGPFHGLISQALFH